MLLDITYTSARLNTTPVPCIKQSTKFAEKPARTVTFTEQGMLMLTGYADCSDGGGKETGETATGDAADAAETKGA
jgi:hypothetical protein